MRIISDVLGKEFTSVEECQKAEEEYSKQLAEKEAKKQELMTQRKERASEIEQSYQKVLEARKEYNKLVDNFVKDYGSYHFSVTKNIDKLEPLFPLSGWFDDIFNMFWK